MSRAKGSGEIAAQQSTDAREQGQSGNKRERLLTTAASLMAKQGYGRTSIRNVARETGFSLAGMYYYFENKEDLLFQIQHRTFASLLEVQERAMAEKGDAEQKLKRLVGNHLSYFTHHFSELKVCTFELDSLHDERYRTIEALRRRYFACVAEVIADIMGRPTGESAPDPLVRRHTLFVFGMLNWIFMWFDPERDTPVEELGNEMVAMILHGLRADGTVR